MATPKLADDAALPEEQLNDLLERGLLRRTNAPRFDRHGNPVALEEYQLTPQALRVLTMRKREQAGAAALRTRLLFVLGEPVLNRALVISLLNSVQQAYRDQIVL